MSVESPLLAKLSSGGHSFNVTGYQLQDILLKTFQEELLLKPSQLKGVVFDFGSLFPGDFQGEEFTSEVVSSMDWFFKGLTNALKELGLSIVVSFTKPSQEEVLKNIFKEGDVTFELRNLSLSHIMNWKSRGVLALSVNHVLILHERLKNGTEAPEKGFSLVSLWGHIEKVGAHWVNNDTTLNEIYELKAGGETRVSHVLIDGPLGKLVSWQDVKGKCLGEVAPATRTLHFFGELTEGEFSKNWNEFFFQDQCRQCLPCYLVRKKMKGEALTNLFKGKAIYQCHLPELYSRGHELYEGLFRKEGGA